jgi:ABC-type nitrate/sulfonate/bicarbonate transport system substrate-binding protein
MRNRGKGESHWLPVVVVALAVGAGAAFQLLIRQDYQTPPAPLPVSVVGVRLMGALGPAFAGDMVASRAGLFEQEGILIQLRPANDTSDSISSVASGVDAIGISRADSFLVARARGVPIIAFAAAFVESPAVFYVLQKSGLRTPQAFVGRPIGRRAGDDTAVIYDALIARLGLPRSMIRMVSVGSDLSMLLRGDVDVWPGHIGEEDYMLTRQGVDYTIIMPGSYGIHVPGTVYFASERTISEQPQLVQRYLKAVIAGWELAYGDMATSVPMIAAFHEKSLTLDYVHFVLEREREYLRPQAMRFGEYDDRQWRSLQDILVSQKLLKQPIDMSKAVTYEFLREAYRKPYTFGK